MAFINEWISQEDIEKYKLIELNDYYLKKDYSCYKEWMKLHWCVDKEREIWFTYVVSPHLEDHRDGWTGEDFYILHYQGRNIEIVLERLHGSVKLTDNPFYINWKLLRINEEDMKELAYEEVLSVLREVLNCYGGKGILYEELQGKLVVELKEAHEEEAKQMNT